MTERDDSATARRAAETGQSVDSDPATAYEAVLRETTDSVFVFAVEERNDEYGFRFRRSNSSYRQQIGVPADDIRGETPGELFDDEQSETVTANARRCVENRAVVEYHETFDSSGKTTHQETTLTPIVEDGAVTQVVGVARDVTDENETEQRSTVRQFETVMETMSAAMFLKDTDGRYLLMNRAGRELFGVDADEIVGLTDDDLFPPTIAQKARADDRHVIETGERVEIEETVPTAAGPTERLTRKSPVYDEDGDVTALCGVSTDITEQKERENEIQGLKERFELAVEGANLGVWDWDMTVDEVTYNEQWAQMLGHSLDELTLEFEEWEKRVHPEDLDRAETALSEHIAGDADLYEAEHRLQTADGDWKWVQTVGTVVERDDDGEPVRAVGIHIDTDDRKQYEQTLERQRDKLEVLNQMVRHDVRNALQLVLLYGNMLSDSVEDDGEEHLQQVLDAAKEAIDITQTAGDVTEVLLSAESDRTPVALRPALDGQVENARASHDRALISLKNTIPPVDVLADEMLDSVYRNILNNAVVHCDTEPAEVTVSATATGEAVQVRIADNGPGVPDEQKDQIFQEGTKALDSAGTGLGLSLVQTLVNRYGGDVWVEDNEPEGSVFIVELLRDD